MSRLGALVRRESRYLTLKQPPEAFWGSSYVSNRSSSGASVTEDTAIRHGDVYACVRVLADAAGSLPLIVYRRTAEGRTREPSHPVARLLANPAPGLLTRGLLVATIITHLNLYGNAFLLKRRSQGQLVPDWLGFIDPARIEIGISQREPFYNVAQAGDLLDGKRLTRDEVLHIKTNVTLDGVIGIPPITAKETLGLGMTLSEFAGTWFANGSTPSGVINVAGTLTNEAAETLRSRWEARHGGSRRGGTAVLEQGTTFQPITMSMLDAQFLEQRRMSATEIARIFRVPPWMIGADSGDPMTYSNVESQQLSFVTHSLRPWLVLIEDHLKADPDFFADDGELYPEFLLDALLRADSATRAAVYTQALAGKPWMTRNEVRERENLDHLESGDELDAALPTDPAAPTPPADAARSLFLNGAVAHG